MEDEDNYPFDRDHWVASVDVPVAHLSRSTDVEAIVESAASRRGGRVEMWSRPVADRVGSPGFETFGAAVAFEAGDANAAGFLKLVVADLEAAGISGAQATLDEDNIFAPAEPEPSAHRR